MDDTGRLKAFYLRVGLGGLVLVAAFFALNAQRENALMYLLGALISAVVIVVWMLQGIRSVERRERDRQAAREAAAAHAEAQEAARRVAQQVNAKRTVSHGGLTINVHRAHAQEEAVPAQDVQDEARS